MNRRNFLRSLCALPFVGVVAASKSLAEERELAKLGWYVGVNQRAKYRWVAAPAQGIDYERMAAS